MKRWILLVACVVVSSTGCDRHKCDAVAPDGCNICSCDENGNLACTTRACFPPSPGDDAGVPDGGGIVPGGANCDFATTYTYGPIGGNAATTIQSVLSPGNHYRHQRTPNLDRTAPVLACEPPMPACGTSDRISAYDIEVHDLPNVDVQRALAAATPPLYGYDPRPVDGTVFSFQRATGGGFLVGGECEKRTPCTAIPAGIRQLRSRLLALDAQQTAAASCAAVTR